MQQQLHLIVSKLNLLQFVEKHEIELQEPCHVSFYRHPLPGEQLPCLLPLCRVTPQSPLTLFFMSRPLFIYLFHPSMVFLQLAILLPSSLCSYPRPKTCQAKVNGKWMVVQVLILCFVPEKRYNFALQEGEVVRVKGSTVEICEDGKIRTKHKSEVPQPLMLACGGENYKKNCQNMCYVC